MDEALERNVDMAELISFCRAYDELLADLLDLKLDWFVRSDSGEIYDTIMTKGVLELVQNKWQDNQHKCYRVTNVTKFSQLYLGLSDDNEMPRHYILETIKLLLTSIYRMMMKQCWNGGQPLGCLMYLCEQPDYINYDQFLEENSKPFETVTVECASYDDFKKRVHLIKESFWYLRNLNAIDINTALALFKDCNQGKYNEEFLRLANAKYCDQFEKFMGQNQQMELEERIHMITSHVKMLAVDQLVEDWDFEFKQHTLLEILAGLGAVWALHASKDVASTGQYLKPHCIQVLGVLRLLSADDNRQAVQNHLAQVLTGQGKSLVLAMAACVLALCGHSVVILCYKENINTFRQQYAAQFDRLNIVTVNTSLEEKEKFIAEAGVSRTITLATREMGRGVDYKSSVTVEKNGGVHVIQTFFSLDIKEETQIKGRTARKDNRGSYELILCYDDLKKKMFGGKRSEDPYTCTNCGFVCPNGARYDTCVHHEHGCDQAIKRREERRQQELRKQAERKKQEDELARQRYAIAEASRRQQQQQQLAEQKRLEDQRKAKDQKRQQEKQQQEELARQRFAIAEATRRHQEQQRLEEQKRLAEQKRLEELRRAEEQKRLEEEKKLRQEKEMEDMLKRQQSSLTRMI
ncbi:hypothetical protein pipiens_013473 [Culex pipiens pipiens]|uniref:SecA family profile domain-containing protein n=1 Tax=Culex pipiens pipiens TaxID=38569 RepID=A0ABD1CYS5_CULPP